MNRVFTKWSGRLRFIPKSTYTKNSLLILNAALPNTQDHKVRIKGKVDQSRVWSCTLPYALVL